jgi:hypothetical protein
MVFHFFCQYVEAIQYLFTGSVEGKQVLNNVTEAIIGQDTAGY